MSRIEQKRRELFEAFLDEMKGKLVSGPYHDPASNAGWIAWNAALDAVVIDIRKDYFPGSDNMGGIVLDKNYSRFAFLRIIEDTGLGIKVKS